MKLQNRLFLSLLLMGAAALAIGAISLLTLRGTFDNQSKVYNSGLAVYHLKKVSDAYGLDVTGAVQKVRNGDSWAWEEGGKAIIEAEKSAEDHWKAYLEMDKSKEEKSQAAIVGALMDNNKHLMESLQSDFANKNARDLEIQATSVITPSIGPILDNIRKLEDINEKIGQEAIAQAEKGFGASFDFLAAVVVFLLLAGLGLSFWLGTWAIRPLGSLSQGFVSNVEQVAGQSEQVSAVTSQLSSHLMESAIQLKQAGSAMEKLTFMAQQNKQETILARHYMEEAKSSISAIGASAHKTVDYMKNLGQGAEKVFQVVKIIEEIAFQTNILALNAGVEAVRAGEQGKEFVVVVEEIRNLSQRCSQVARETSKLVTENVHQTSEGVRLSEETGKAIAQALELSSKAGSLLTVIQEGMEFQANSLHEIHSKTGTAEQEAYRNSSMGEKIGSLGQNINRQTEGLRGVSRQLAGLLLGGVPKPQPRATVKAPSAPETTVPAAAPSYTVEKATPSKDMKMMEKTGTDDAKIVHMNK
jgi:methyl-accepting chemotaxis protein